MRKAFGLKGELFVAPITSEPGEVFAPGRVVNAEFADRAAEFADRNTEFATPNTEFADRNASPGASRGSRGSTDDRANGPPRDFTIERSRPFKDGWLVKLAGVDDKTAADRWRGVTLRVPFSELTPPVENELYLHELPGMAVRDEPHGDLGVVAGWYELPQGIVLEVRGPAWRADVPFNEAFVTSVDRAARVIAVTLPDGLLEPAD